MEGLLRIIYSLKKLFYSITCRVSDILLGVIIIMMLLTVVDVCLRYIFNMPILGGSELTELMMVIIILGSLAYTMTIRGHTTVDLVVNRLAPRTRAIVDTITYSVSLLLFCLIIWRTIIQAKISWINEVTTVELAIPIFPFYIFVAFGITLLCLVLLGNLLESITKLLKK